MTDQSNQKLSVLVLEDEDLLREAIIKKLESEGIHTISCSTGEQALDYLGNLSRLPDVIWLDYYLKGMNGLEFVHSLQRNENWKEIPVLVVSNSASPEKVEKMLSAGAKRYLLKADNRLDEIVPIVHELAGEKKQE